MGTTHHFCKWTAAAVSQLGSRTVVHVFEGLFATDQLVDAVGERHLAEHGGSIVCVQAVLSALCALAFLDKADVDELIEMVVERAVVDVEYVLEFLRTHLAAVNESIEDLIPGAVADSRVHVEVFVEAENALLGQQVCRIVRGVTANRPCLIRRHRTSQYESEMLSRCQAEISQKYCLLYIFAE